MLPGDHRRAAPRSRISVIISWPALLRRRERSPTVTVQDAGLHVLESPPRAFPIPGQWAVAVIILHCSCCG